MFIKIASVALQGLEACIVEVEVDAKQGLPGQNMVGLPDAAVKESRNRVEAAIKNSGFVYPYNKFFTINLAPAYLRKEGPLYDLPIAIGMLATTGQIACGDLENSVFFGELSLDGRIKPVHGVLPMCIYARERGYKRVFLPEANAREGAMVEGLDVMPVSSLGHVAGVLAGKQRLEPYKVDLNELFREDLSYAEDFVDVKGQEFVKRGIEIAAAGGHNILMVGSPGCGKTMIARRIPTILPSMNIDESLEVTKLYSISGQLASAKGLVTHRPFRSPHHTVSSVALVGGTSVPKPGAVSLAHLGVLFLDELAEFRREALESLRQPVEDGLVTISRARSTYTYPARFMLVAAVNPCPCGYAYDSDVACTCSHQNKERYWQRLSGPLLDRIDIHIEVKRLTEEELISKRQGEGSAEIRKRVEAARLIQQQRLKGLDVHCNAHMTPALMKKYCVLDLPCEQLMRNAIRKLMLSARSYDRILKVARTIADLEGIETIRPQHIAEAIQFRGIDRVYRQQL